MDDVILKIIQEKQQKLPIIPIDTKTRLGKVAAVRTIEGERYYFMVDKQHCVAMIPATAMDGIMLKPMMSKTKSYSAEAKKGI